MNLSHHDLQKLCQDVTTAHGVVQSIWYTDESTWVFQTRRSGENHYFVVCCDPRWVRIHLVDGKRADAHVPDSLTMLMRKWLVPSYFHGAQVDENDRLVALRFERDDESFELMLEVPERFANLTLVRDKKILGCHVTNDRVRIHKPWSPPPVQAHALIHDVIGPVLLGQASEMIARKADEEISQFRRNSERATVQQTLHDALKRLRRRERAVSRDLARVSAVESLKRKGELLKTLHGKIAPGTETVTVIDYWDPNLKQTEVALDPTRTLQQNIDRAFHEYRRLKNAQEKVEQRLHDTMELIERVDAIDARLADDAITPQEAWKEIRALRLVPKIQAAKSDPALRLPYRQFLSHRGATIWVGRSAKDNDELTLRHARGRDIWLHARDVAGSHVILRLEKNVEVDGQDLLDAAMLAGWFSKAKEDTVIDVIWTPAKFVRKPKGAAPGSVSAAGTSTISVRRDEEKIQALLASEVQEKEKPA